MRWTLRASVVLAVAVVFATLTPVASTAAQKSFHRIATFPAVANICLALQTTPGNNDCFDRPAVAEIVDASADGNQLIYTDSFNHEIGLIDIFDPANPQPLGTIPVGGEPTSVAVAGRYALVGVNTSPSFAMPSGHLTVIDMVTRMKVPGAAAIPLGGQPDSIAVSPSGRYAAIVIENERDEDLGDGRPPQVPPGFLIALHLVPNDPTKWTLRPVSLTGLATKFPGDPEPEFVDINNDELAVVSMQENNHFALVDLRSARVVRSFEAGTVDLTDIDHNEEDVINFNEDLNDVPREPDAVGWISDNLFASANEGDLDGGSRGFSIFNKYSPFPVFDSASDYEYLGGVSVTIRKGALRTREPSPRAWSSVG